MASGALIYRVDERDRLIFVNEAWQEFARENGVSITRENVLNHSLWDFVADETTRILYQDLLKRVRGEGSVHFTFRCDSPWCRRFMQMAIRCPEDKHVEFETRCLHEEPREPLPLLDMQIPRSEEFLRVCAWCKKVELEGTWVEVEAAIDTLKLFERENLPRLTHGVCPECYWQIRRLITAP